MKHIKQFVNEINLSNSTSYKREVLKKYMHDQKVRAFLKYYFDPFSVTNISTKKLSKVVPIAKPTESITSLSKLLDFLVSRCTGKDNDIAAIQAYIAKYPNDKEFIEGIVAKTIKMGISGKTINDVFGFDFISNVDLQLAEKYFDNQDYVKGKEFAITLKLDGIRCLAIKKGKDVILMSRQGKPIEDADEIVKEVSRLKIRDIVIDGELLVDNWCELSNKDAYKATTKIVRRDGRKKGIKLVVFDCFHPQAFETKEYAIPYYQRRKIFEELISGCKFLEPVPLLYIGKNVDEILNQLQIAKHMKQEGLMINICDAGYEFRRTKNLLKVKLMNDADLEVIGYQEGKGRLRGTLGALIVDYKGRPVSVGSGFSDDIRRALWKRKDKLIGRVIKVQYFEETEDSLGNKSLRFPVFLELLPKGKEPSLY